MESIKHKMDTMVKEKDAATEKAVALEAEASEFNKTLTKFEKVLPRADQRHYRQIIDFK